MNKMKKCWNSNLISNRLKCLGIQKCKTHVANAIGKNEICRSKILTNQNIL